MKTNRFLFRAALVAGVALCLAPISLPLTASFVAVVGLLAIASRDYDRRFRPLPLPVRAPVPAARPASLPLAV
jgi:hypothetical protein